MASDNNRPPGTVLVNVPEYISPEDTPTKPIPIPVISSGSSPTEVLVAAPAEEVLGAIQELEKTMSGLRSASFWSAVLNILMILAVVTVALVFLI